MLTEVISRLNNVRIPRALTPIAPNQYEVCAHWWSWWLPHNPALTWEFIDASGNIVTATSTYGTDTVILTTTAPVPDLFLFVPVLPLQIRYFSEITENLTNIDRPTLFIFADSEVEWNKFSYVSRSFQAALIIPAKDNITADLNWQIHDGMLNSIKEYFTRALLEVERAEFVPNHTTDRNLGKTGNNLFPIKATVLLFTLTATHFGY